MRKIFSLLIVIVIVLGFLPANTYATDKTESRNIIAFEDGSYIEIIVADIFAIATNAKNGYKTYTHYDSADNVEWQAKLSASFTYNGTTYSCNSTSCTVTVYDSKWYEISNTTTRGGSMATTQLTMGRKLSGITVSKPAYTITLTCDKDGNLS